VVGWSVLTVGEYVGDQVSPGLVGLTVGVLVDVVGVAVGSSVECEDGD
jgi:hypothetical protein